MAIQGTALLSRRQDELRDMFFRDLDARLPRLRAILKELAARPACADALLDELRAQVHEIKGSGRPFGVPSASAIAMEVEVCLEGREGYPDLRRLGAFVDDLAALLPQG